MYHKVETQVLHAVVDYLIKKPFGEVSQLINALSRAEKLEDIEHGEVNSESSQETA